MLALDANFRLKNRIRKNESNVGTLGEGLGYFVATEPYKDHLRNYIKEYYATGLTWNSNVNLR